MPACNRDPRDVVEAVDHFVRALQAVLFLPPLLLKPW
jgi:hypothetical protein